MKIKSIFSLLLLCSLTACGSNGEVGSSCTDSRECLSQNCDLYDDDGNEVETGECVDNN